MFVVLSGCVGVVLLCCCCAVCVFGGMLVCCCVFLCGFDLVLLISLFEVNVLCCCFCVFAGVGGKCCCCELHDLCVFFEGVCGMLFVRVVWFSCCCVYVL